MVNTANYQATPEYIDYFRKLIAIAESGDTETSADLLFHAGTMISSRMQELSGQLQAASAAAKIDHEILPTGQGEYQVKRYDSEARAKRVTDALHLSKSTDEGQSPPTRDQLLGAGMFPDVANFLVPRLESAYLTARADHPSERARARAACDAMGLSRKPGNPHEEEQPNYLFRYAELVANRANHPDISRGAEFTNGIYERISAKLSQQKPGWDAHWQRVYRLVRRADKTKPPTELIVALVNRYRQMSKATYGNELFRQATKFANDNGLIETNNTHTLEFAEDGMFTCPRMPGGLRLSSQGCASSYQRGKKSEPWEIAHHCQGCEIGAGNAGEVRSRKLGWTDFKPKLMSRPLHTMDEIYLLTAKDLVHGGYWFGDDIDQQLRVNRKKAIARIASRIKERWREFRESIDSEGEQEMAINKWRRGVGRPGRR